MLEDAKNPKSDKNKSLKQHYNSIIHPKITKIKMVNTIKFCRKYGIIAILIYCWWKFKP